MCTWLSTRRAGLTEPAVAIAFPFRPLAAGRPSHIGRGPVKNPAHHLPWGATARPHPGAR